MSKANSLGGGLQTELASVRLRMAHSVRAQPMPAAVPAAAASVPQRKVLAFQPKMPAITKKAPKQAVPKFKGKARLVVKVNVKSPFLQRRLGL